MIVLSYLGILAVIPLVLEKEDKEVQWHAKHGLVLLVAEVILAIVMFVLMHIPILGCAITILWFLIILGLIVLHVMCMVKGINGDRLLIPYLSEYADKF